MSRVKKHDQTPTYITEIGKLMAEYGHSQNDLADKLGVSRDRVNNWLLDTAPLDADNIVKIANLYGVTTDRLLGVPEKSTGFSQKAVDNVRRFRSFVEDFYHNSEFDSISQDHFIQKFSRALDNVLGCSNLAPFLVAIANVGLARYAAAEQLKQAQNPQAAAGALIKLRFALYQVGEQGQAIARELHDTDKVENELRSIVQP